MIIRGANYPEIMRIIALSGPVGVGKDSLGELIGKFVIDPNGYLGMKLPIAYQLKKELEKPIRQKYNVSSFSEVREEKALFRDYMISYAEEKRAKMPKYWMSKWFENAKLAIDRCDVEPVFVITDLRHAIDPSNDLAIIKKNNGYVIYIERYTNSFFVERSVHPYGESEEKNDKHLKDNADFVYRWADGEPIFKFWESRDSEKLIKELEKYLKV